MAVDDKLAINRTSMTQKGPHDIITELMTNVNKENISILMSH